jgi:hypothetical protein
VIAVAAQPLTLARAASFASVEDFPAPGRPASRIGLAGLRSIKGLKSKRARKAAVSP